MFQKSFSILHPIASSPHAMVYKAVPKQTAAKNAYSVAAKVIAKPAGETPSAWDVQRWTREATHWQCLSGKPGICTLYDVFEDDETLVLVSEYCEGGTLRGKDKDITWPMARGLVTAVASCHRVSLCHGGITPDHVYLTDRGDVRLGGGFGCSQVATGPCAGLWIEEGEGDGAYAAPEVLARREYGTRADVWSLGMCLKDSSASSVRLLAELCLEPDPEKRPDVDKI